MSLVIDQDFVALMNEVRQRKHLSIRALARIAQVPPATAQGWLSGKHSPTPALRANFQRLIEHLGLVEAAPPELQAQWRTAS